MQSSASTSVYASPIKMIQDGIKAISTAKDQEKK